MNRTPTFVIEEMQVAVKALSQIHYLHLSNLKKVKVFMLKQKKLLDFKVVLMVKKHLLLIVLDYKMDQV